VLRGNITVPFASVNGGTASENEMMGSESHIPHGVPDCVDGDCVGSLFCMAVPSEWQVQLQKIEMRIWKSAYLVGCGTV